MTYLSCKLFKPLIFNRQIVDLQSNLIDHGPNIVGNDKVLNCIDMQMTRSKQTSSLLNVSSSMFSIMITFDGLAPDTY